MPPPRLWTPIRPGPAIRNTGISTISRSRIIPGGPDAHHHTQNAETSTATATSTRPAVSSESEPNAAAATRLYVQIAIRLPAAVTTRSRRTSFRRRSGSIATASIVTQAPSQDRVGGPPQRAAHAIDQLTARRGSGAA